MLDENSRPYFSMLGAVADIQSKFDFYMDQIENSGDMDAAQALLLTFVRNYCRIVKRFNHKLEELPSFYLHEILNYFLDKIQEKLNEKMRSTSSNKLC